ncbi:MAG: NAD(P)-binding protein [Cyanobacteria bacterium J06635_1]
MSQDNRKKIAVLGGGMGSLATVYELTNQPGWEARYDITVYQLGWRLGGKGASGRNVQPDPNHPDQAPNYRIEEHGLHIFFGFYENAFRLMKQCYDELGEDGPFSSVEDAFHPHDLIVLENYANGEWHPWRFDFPRNDMLPWGERTPSNLWDHLVSALELIYRVWENSKVLGSPSSFCPTTPGGVEAFFKQIYRNLESLGLVAGALFTSVSEQVLQSLMQNPQQWLTQLGSLGEHINRSAQTPAFGSEGVYLHLAKELVGALPDNHRHHWKEHHTVLQRLIERFMEELEDLWHDQLNDDPDLRRELIITNYGLANIRAILAEGMLFESSLDALDQYDYGEWLKSYGAWDETLQSPMVRAIYDLVYAYPKGDIANPQMAAGVALRVVINIFFRYKGAIMWKMQAGMGDTIFAPLYKVLKRRGVKFEFFHRVTALRLSEDQSEIESIEVVRQVTLNPKYEEYDPLIRVKGLLCWPSEPRYEYIDPVQAEKLQVNKINLESFWTPWQDPEPPLTLKARTEANPEGEFDLVILGISLAALPYLCGELLQADKTDKAKATSQQWRDMLEHVQTVTTQGDQFWLKPTLSQLGWPMPSAVVGTYVEPLDTYADMTHLLAQENWPEADYPHNLAYFTGVIPDPGMPPASDYGFPAQAQAQFDEQIQLFLDNYIGPLWPKTTPPNNPNGLNRSLLVSQFLRINIFPTERYVMSVPKSTEYRLKADESGFDNLYLTGDWIRNGFNAGAIEPTVISGLQSARAILEQEFSLSPVQGIIGEDTNWM